MIIPNYHNMNRHISNTDDERSQKFCPPLSSLAPCFNSSFTVSNDPLLAASQIGVVKDSVLSIAGLFGSAPLLSSNSAGSQDPSQQAIHSGVAWGGEGAGRLTHLFEVYTNCTSGVDDLLSELGFSPFEFVLRSKTVEFQRARQPPGEAPWCPDLAVVRQLLGQGSVSSSCNFVNGMLLHHFIKNIIIILGEGWNNVRFITFASCK